jgi:hypothetical protein
VISSGFPPGSSRLHGLTTTTVGTPPAVSNNSLNSTKHATIASGAGCSTCAHRFLAADAVMLVNGTFPARQPCLLQVAAAPPWPARSGFAR